MPDDVRTPIRDGDHESRTALYAALACAVAHAHGVQKDKVNSQFDYGYASAEAIYAEARAALAEHGLTLIPTSSVLRRPGEGEQYENPYQRGQFQPVGLVLVRHYMLVHKAGGMLDLGPQEWPIVVEKGRPVDKALAAADTASLSYRLRDLLQLPRVEKGTGLDDDDRQQEGAEDARERAAAREAQRVDEVAAILAAVSTAKPAEIQGHDKASHTLGPVWGPRVRAYCRARYLVATGKGMSRLPDDMQEPLAKVRAFMAERGIPDRIHDGPPPGPPGGTTAERTSSTEDLTDPGLYEKADPLDRQRALARVLSMADTVQPTQGALATFNKMAEAELGPASEEWGTVDALVGVLSEALAKGISPDKVRRKGPVKDLVEEAKRIRVGTCGLTPFPPIPGAFSDPPEVAESLAAIDVPGMDGQS